MSDDEPFLPDRAIDLANTRRKLEIALGGIIRVLKRCDPDEIADGWVLQECKKILAEIEKVDK